MIQLRGSTLDLNSQHSVNLWWAASGAKPISEQLTGKILPQSFLVQTRTPLYLYHHPTKTIFFICPIWHIYIDRISFSQKFFQKSYYGLMQIYQICLRCDVRVSRKFAFIVIAFYDDGILRRS